MGLPGSIDVEITTTFDDREGSVSRKVRFVSGWGLNCLAASEIGDPDCWNINRSIVADTIDLPDGRHKIDRQHVGPGQFDWKWTPVENAEDCDEDA